MCGNLKTLTNKFTIRRRLGFLSSGMWRYHIKSKTVAFIRLISVLVVLGRDDNLSASCLWNMWVLVLRKPEWICLNVYSELSIFKLQIFPPSDNQRFHYAEGTRTKLLEYLLILSFSVWGYSVINEEPNCGLATEWRIRSMWIKYLAKICWPIAKEEQPI